jgi:hypothetical protein
VVIDSIAFAFQHGVANMAQRTRLLTWATQTLARIAHEREIAIVVTNQATSRIEHHPSSNGGSGGFVDVVHIAPALGESFGHNSAVRIRLFWNGHTRCALVEKSLDLMPSHCHVPIPFAIDSTGVRSIAT